MGRVFDDWETLALGLAAGLLCQVAPGLVAATLAVGIGTLHLRSDAPAHAHLWNLLVLGAITLAGLLGGPYWVLAAALTWRVGLEIAKSRDAGAWLALAAAPAAALLHRTGAPDVLTHMAWCLALVAWIAWSVEQLAAWRLGARVSLRFPATQVAILAPLLALSSAGPCLAAFVAMALARATLPATRSSYAAA